jgi:hypothetical protein
MIVLTVPHAVCEQDPSNVCHFSHVCDYHAPFAARAIQKAIVAGAGSGKNAQETILLEAEVNRCTTDYNRIQSRTAPMRTKMRKYISKDPANTFVLDVHSYPQKMPTPYQHWENYDAVFMVHPSSMRLAQKITRCLQKLCANPILVIERDPVCDIVNEVNELQSNGMLCEFNERLNMQELIYLAEGLAEAVQFVLRT